MSKILIVQGLENAQKYEERLKNIDPANQVAFILEPNGIAPPNNWSGTHIFNGSHAEDFAAFLLTHLSSNRKMTWILSFEVIEEKSAVGPRKDFFDRALAQFHALKEYGFSLSGFREDSLSGLRNALTNLESIRTSPGISSLKNAFQNSTAVILSAGPSLTKSLKKLQSVQENFVIISVDAALKPALAAGVRPHFVCCLERDESTLPFFENLKAPIDTHLVYFPVVHPEVLRRFSGPRWAAYRTYKIHQFFDQYIPRGLLRTGHSVAHMAVCLAEQLGCNRAVLVGQDLAFDPEGFATHSQGIAYREWAETKTLEALKESLAAEGDQLYWMKGNLTERVPTRGYYIVFAREMASLARSLTLQIVNATEGGMMIEGLSWCSLNAVLSENIGGNFDVRRLAREAFETASRRSSDLPWQPLLDRMDQVSEFAKNTLKTLSLVSKNLDKADSSAQKKMIEGFWVDYQSLISDDVAFALGFEISGADLLKYEAEIYESMEQRAYSKACLALMSAWQDLAQSLADSKQILRYHD